jgi:hypothetical protein
VRILGPSCLHQKKQTPVVPWIQPSKKFQLRFSIRRIGRLGAVPFRILGEYAQRTRQKHEMEYELTTALTRTSIEKT